jgi:transcriptional regulator with XRE-family HTH domain
VRQRDHGTIACYRWGIDYGPQDWRKGCRCQACRTAANIYNIQLQRRRDRGEETLRDCSAAREHLLWLRSKGVGLRAVAAATGIARHTVWKIARGQTRRSKHETIERIMAVGTHLRAPGGFVDAAPTWRLIDEMLAEGFTKELIATELGSTAKRPALQISRDQVMQKTADNVREVYDRLMAPTLTARAMVAERKARNRRNAAERLKEAV